MKRWIKKILFKCQSIGYSKPMIYSDIHLAPFSALIHSLLARIYANMLLAFDDIPSVLQVQYLNVWRVIMNQQQSNINIQINTSQVDFFNFGLRVEGNRKQTSAPTYAMVSW